LLLRSFENAETAIPSRGLKSKARSQRQPGSKPPVRNQLQFWIAVKFVQTRDYDRKEVGEMK